MTSTINATMLRAGLRAAVVVAVAGLLAAPAAQAQQKQQQRGPLVLKSASYFYVGGKIDAKAKGSPIVGHMYVEYMIPQQLRSPYPIVMVHGGNQTGTNFTGTPDGREGWAQYFVRRGYAVYIVDQVARGRSAHWNECHGDGAALAAQPGRGALRRAGALPDVAAGQAAHAMARHRQAGRRRPSISSMPRRRCRSRASPSSRRSIRRRSSR